MVHTDGVTVNEAATSLVLQAISILKLGIIPKESLTARKSNSELVCSISNLLSTSLSVEGQDQQEEGLQPDYSFESTSKTLYIPDPASLDQPDYATEDRSLVDLTAKFWYLDSAATNAVQASRNLSPNCVKQALGILRKTTGLQEVDTLIMQLPKLHYDEADLSEQEEDELIGNVISLYNGIGKLPNITSLGLSEFSLPRLERLYQKGSLAKPPRVNQVNLRDCCSVQQDLVDFAKKEELELLTHSDCSDLLSDSTFESLLRDCKDKLPSQLLPAMKDGSKLQARWVLKYTVLLKERSLVADKGYIVFASV